VISQEDNYEAVKTSNLMREACKGRSEPRQHNAAAARLRNKKLK